MKAVMTPLTQGATSLLARPRVVLTIIPAKRQNSHSGSEKYEKAPLVTAPQRAGMSILTRIYAHVELALPLLVKHGEALYHELELLICAGLSTVDALRVVTSLPVKCFNLNDRSVIEVRKRADLVPICKTYSGHSSDKFDLKGLVW
jgi:hypothetical protein